MFWTAGIVGMDTPGTSGTVVRRSSSRLSLSKKVSNSTSKASSKGSEKSTSSRTINNNVDLRDNPFPTFTGTLLTIEEQDDLVSAAPDAFSLSSRGSPEMKVPIVAPIAPSVIYSVSSESDSEVTPKKKSRVSEFFTPSKSRTNRAPPSATATSSGLGVSSLKSTTRKTVSSSKTDPKKVTKVRRQICKSTSIKMLTNKYFDETQKRIPAFFHKKDDAETPVGYHTVMKSSKMPAIVTGDEDVEQFLAVEVREGVEPLRPSQIEGPPVAPVDDDPEKILERIEVAQSACYDERREAINMEEDEVAVVIPSEPDVDSGISHSSTVRKPAKTPAPKRQSTARTSTAKKQRKPRGPVIVPKYKIVAGTTFAVDAFRYGDIEGVSHYFLSHFHADHYIGLKKSFDKPLIMSRITAELVKAFINVDSKHFILIDLHVPVEIDGVRITALDANHCPGAILFLFQLPTGTNILHTGDFRASAAMEEYPEFWNFDIHTIYLDTTYLSTKYCFKDQWQSITDATEEVRTFLNRNIGANVLIVCGSYLVGKEKVWLELATKFGFRVWTEPNRRKALDAVAAGSDGSSMDISMVVDDPRDAEIHVLSMNKLSYDELVAYMDEFPDRNCVLAIRPSGWEKNSRPQYRSRINIVGVEYSEHSSYDELRRFVRFLRPREVISTVPYGNSNLNRTPQVPVSWYQGPIRPEKPPLQTAITSYFKVGADKGKGKTDEEKVSVEEPVPGVNHDGGVKPVVEEGTIAEEVQDSDSDWM